MNNNLFDLSVKAKDLLDKIFEAGPEGTEDVTNYIIAYEITLEDINTEIEQLGMVVKELTMTADNHRELAANHMTKAKYLERQADEITSQVKHTMQYHNIRKAGGPERTASILRGRLSVNCPDTILDNLPEDYKSVVVKPKKTDLRKMLENEAKSQGVDLSSTDIFQSNEIEGLTLVRGGETVVFR